MAKILDKPRFDLESYSLDLDDETPKKFITSIIPRPKLEYEIMKLNEHGYTVYKSKSKSHDRIKLYAQKIIIEK